jgi:hypothetical protein
MTFETHLRADASAQVGGEDRDDDVQHYRDVGCRAARDRKEFERDVLDEKRNDQADDEPDRSARDLRGSEIFDGVFDHDELVFENGLRERGEEEPDDRSGDRREDEKRELNRLAGHVQREDAQVGLAAEQESGDGKDHREHATQHGTRQVVRYSNVTNAPHTSFATKRPRVVRKRRPSPRASKPAGSYSATMGA